MNGTHHTKDSVFHQYFILDISDNVGTLRTLLTSENRKSLKYWGPNWGGGGGAEGAKFLAGTYRWFDVDETQRRRIDVISTSCAR